MWYLIKTLKIIEGVDNKQATNDMIIMYRDLGIVNDGVIFLGTIP